MLKYCVTFAVSVRDVCYKVTSTKCSSDLHYEKTFLPTENQKASELTILQPIIDSACSPDIEKYLCQTRMPPCTADISVVHLPCREFCRRITRDCGDVLKANSIPALDCDYLFPQGDSSNGLCDLKQWPAPWPWKIPDPSPPVSGKAWSVEVMHQPDSVPFIQSVSQSVSQSASQPLSQSASLSVGQSVSQSVSHSVSTQSVFQLDS